VLFQRRQRLLCLLVGGDIDAKREHACRLSLSVANELIAPLDRVESAALGADVVRKAIGVVAV